MRKSLRVLLPLAVAAMPVAAMGSAQADDGETYQATLNEINGSGGSGMLTVTLDGNEATVNESWSGLAAKFKGGPFPHVQHAHIAGQGTCPTQSADKNGDGIVDTVEGQPAYGMIGTTFSVKGDTSAKAGTAVVVVHGLDPTTLSKKAAKAKSNLVPELPLAATAPALCGTLSSMPSGGPDTGAGSTGGTEDLGLLGLGGGLLAAAGATYVIGRRRTRRTQPQG